MTMALGHFDEVEEEEPNMTTYTPDTYLVRLYYALGVEAHTQQTRADGEREFNRWMAHGQPN